MDALEYVVLQQRGNKIIEFEKKDYLSFAKSEDQLELLSKQKMSYQGEISEAGQRRMKKIITIWSQSIMLLNRKDKSLRRSSHRVLNFLTLTLPARQRHGDREIKKKVLTPFIRKMKAEHGMQNYIWKAESQENQNIHFHLMIDVFIDKDVIRREWNACCNELLYVDRFSEKFGHSDPPSTRIETVADFANIESYLSKYIGKSDGYRLIEGAVWKCSKSLSTLRYFEIDRSTFEEQKLTKAVMSKEIKFASYEHVNVYYVSEVSFKSFLSSYATMLYNIYSNALVQHLYVNDNQLSFTDVYMSMRHQSKNHNSLKSHEIYRNDQNILLKTLSERSKQLKLDILNNNNYEY